MNFPVNLRKCDVCGITKDVINFGKHGRGYRTTCKECLVRLDERVKIGNVNTFQIQMSTIQQDLIRDINTSINTKFEMLAKVVQEQNITLETELLSKFERDKEAIERDYNNKITIARESIIKLCSDENVKRDHLIDDLRALIDNKADKLVIDTKLMEISNTKQQIIDLDTKVNKIATDLTRPMTHMRLPASPIVSPAPSPAPSVISDQEDVLEELNLIEMTATDLDTKINSIKSQYRKLLGLTKRSDKQDQTLVRVTGSLEKLYGEKTRRTGKPYNWRKQISPQLIKALIKHIYKKLYMSTHTEYFDIALFLRNYITT